MRDKAGTTASASTPYNDRITTLTDKQFARVAAFIQDTTGIRVPDQKRDLVRLRLVKRVRALGMTDVDEYVRFALGTGEGQRELANLVDEITTNKTSFYREHDHFGTLRDLVLPALFREDPGLGRERPLILWSAGCASGEEAYTIAMVLADYEREHGPLLAEVHASDICADALRRAIRAVYSGDAALPLPAEMRRRYLLQSKDAEASLVRVAAPIRRRVTFSRVNLLHEAPPFHEPAHVVFCRNVLIYFSRETQERVVRRITAHMAPNGRLFVGHAEMLHGLDLPLAPVRPTVYSRADVA